MNKNQKRRDEILNIDARQYRGGCAYYEKITLAQLEKLVEEDLIDLSDYQNNAPTAREFYEFMKQNPEICAHGYVVEAKRSDYRTTIEGLTYDGPVDMKMTTAFLSLCRHADELVVREDMLYSWWD